MNKILMIAWILAGISSFEMCIRDRHGSSQLRYVLLNACLPLIRFDLTFATYYAKKRAEGKKHRVAITHVAKKLIRVIYALERQDIDFNTQKLR